MLFLPFFVEFLTGYSLSKRVKIKTLCLSHPQSLVAEGSGNSLPLLSNFLKLMTTQPGEELTATKFWSSRLFRNLLLFEPANVRGLLSCDPNQD